MTTKPGAKITTTVVRGLLSDPSIYGDLPPAPDDDAEFALDSLGLVWFLHQVELQYGLALEPAEEHLSGFTSIRRITDYLADLDES